MTSYELSFEEFQLIFKKIIKDETKRDVVGDIRTILKDGDQYAVVYTFYYEKNFITKDYLKIDMSYVNKLLRQKKIEKIKSKL